MEIYPWKYVVRANKDEVSDNSLSTLFFVKFQVVNVLSKLLRHEKLQT